MLDGVATFVSTKVHPEYLHKCAADCRGKRCMADVRDEHPYVMYNCLTVGPEDGIDRFCIEKAVKYMVPDCRRDSNNRTKRDRELRTSPSATPFLRLYGARAQDSIRRWETRLNDALTSHRREDVKVSKMNS